jgi:hypothetical protein
MSPIEIDHVSKMRRTIQHYIESRRDYLRKIHAREEADFSTLMNLLNTVHDFDESVYLLMDDLKEMLLDEDTEISWTARTLIKKTGNHAADAIPELLAVLSKWGVNEYPFITGEILVNLCDAHPEILRFLTEAIRSDNEKLVQAAIETFCLLGKQSVLVYGDLIEIASSRNDASSATKGFAIRALGETGRQEEALCDLLLGFTQHSEWFLRGYAIGAIGKLTLNPDRCLPVVIDVLSDDEGGDWTVRESAVTALGQYGQAARSAIPTLTELRTVLKQEGDSHCVKAVNKALGKIKGCYPALERD